MLQNPYESPSSTDGQASFHLKLRLILGFVIIASTSVFCLVATSYAINYNPLEVSALENLLPLAIGAIAGVVGAFVAIAMCTPTWPEGQNYAMLFAVLWPVAMSVCLYFYVSINMG
jgi:hypothetical protein